MSVSSDLASVLNPSVGTEVVIRVEGVQGVEVQNLRSYGVGIDCHSKFIAVCVHVRNGHQIFRYSSEADTDWNSLLAAKKWVVDTIVAHSNPVPDMSQPLHYVIEATSTYHMPILLAWEGEPCVINPMLAGATKRKTDILDAERLSFHDLTNVWKESYVPSKDIQDLRVLIAERNRFSKLATQSSNRINNIIVRFGFTVARGSSVTKDREVRDLVEDIISDNPSSHENLCPFPLPDDIKSIIRQEYQMYDFFSGNEKLYLSKVREKVFSMNWDTKNGSISGYDLVRILCTAPGVGEITCFTFLAYVGTPLRFPNAKALSAYAGLDPSVKKSAGHVTSTKKRGGCRTLHTILITGADRVIRAHSEAFGRWGFLMAKSSGKWKKAANAVGRKICVALYWMWLTAQEFSYDNYSIVKNAAVFDIPVDDLPLLNPDFKRYIRILHDNDINSTADLITAYLSCSLGEIKGLGRKFFAALRDFLSHQHRYQSDYKKLFPSSQMIETSIDIL